MTRLHASLLAIGMAAMPAVLRAQGDTAAGVAALARGDYQSAARLLQPIAERDTGADPAAQFFLAGMYDAGLGVPQDPLRACALYHRAGGAREPFATGSMRLMKAGFQRRGAEFFADCQLLGNLGFDHRFVPVTFDLGAGHSIAWTLKGATVSYQARTTRHDMRLAGRGAAFLPLRHTALTSGGPAPRVRHFVEVFLWQAGGRSDWRLNWHLFEVSGTDVIRIADEDALAASPVRPAAEAPEDLRELVTVRMNARGQAEWAIVSGPNPRTTTIESEEERRETRALREAENAATSRVDWKRTYDPLRPPALRYGVGQGCGHVLLYAWTDERAETIVVRLDRNALQLAAGAARTIDLASNPGPVSVTVQVYDQPLRSSLFCTDIGVSPGPATETWRAVAGTVTVQLSPPGVRAREPHLYRATIRIDNAEFLGSAGRRQRPPQPIVLSAVVGSMGG